MPEPPVEEMPPLPAVDDLRALLERARRGDPEALPALRAALDAHPEIWLAYGDLAAHAERSWIGLIAGPDLALAEALARKAAALKAELAGPAPTPLERLLVERVAACWLQLNYADAAAAQSRDVSIKQADLALRRQAKAHRGYLTAIGALATVRRLLPAAAGPPGLAREIPVMECKADPGPGDRHASPPAVDEPRIRRAADRTQTGPTPLALFDRSPEVAARDEPDRPRGRRRRPAS